MGVTGRIHLKKITTVLWIRNNVACSEDKNIKCAHIKLCFYKQYRRDLLYVRFPRSNHFEMEWGWDGMGVHGVYQGSTTVKGRGRRYRTGLRKRWNLYARGTESQPGQWRGLWKWYWPWHCFGSPLLCGRKWNAQGRAAHSLSAAEDVIASAHLKTLYWSYSLPVHPWSRIWVTHFFVYIGHLISWISGIFCSFILKIFVMPRKYITFNQQSLA